MRRPQSGRWPTMTRLSSAPGITDSPAALSARAGWRVLFWNGQEIGGGLNSGAVTLPGFCHDRYATNVGLFADSPVYQELQADFDEFGVRLMPHGQRLCQRRPSGRPAVYTDSARTLSRVWLDPCPPMQTGWERLDRILSPHGATFPSAVLHGDCCPQTWRAM